MNKWKKWLASARIHLVILLGLLAAIVFYSNSDHELRQRLQFLTFDTYNKLHQRPPSEDVIIVDLDEESLRRAGQWPWPRTMVAALVDHLNALGARSITFDIVFAEPDRTSPANIGALLPADGDYQNLHRMLEGLPDHDMILAETIARAGNVVTGFTGAGAAETQRLPALKMPLTNMTDMPDLSILHARSSGARGVVTNLPALENSAAGNGSFMASPDFDGIIRQASLFYSFPHPLLQSYYREQNMRFADEAPSLYPLLALEGLRVATGRTTPYFLRGNLEDDGFLTLRIGQHEIPVEPDMRLWVYFRDLVRDNDYVSAYKVMDPAFHEEIADKIQDRIVLVGTSSEGLRDIRSTPLGIFVPGVEVHFNVIEQILQERFLIRPAPVKILEALAIAAMGLVVIFAVPFTGVFLLGLITALAMGAGFIASWLSYSHAGLLLDPVYPALGVGLIFFVAVLLTYIRTEMERRRVRTAFGMYISPDVMREVEKNPDRLKLGGEVKEMTILFSDIRNFTSISETLGPEELINLMNDFLTPMSELVMDNRGTIDKYIGDAMMAFWNAPLDDPDHAANACRAALGMNKALIPINDALKEREKRTGQAQALLKAGIGINTGLASVGNMGSRQRFAYSALGDTVNLAARLEGQTKAYHCSILIGAGTQKAIPGFATLEMDKLRVVGRQEPEHIYGLIGDEDYAAALSFRNWRKAHEEMIACYRAGDFKDALAALATCRDIGSPRLRAFYDMYQKRIKALIKTPPPESWNGVFIAKEK